MQGREYLKGTYLLSVIRIDILNIEDPDSCFFPSVFPFYQPTKTLIYKEINANVVKIGKIPGYSIAPETLERLGYLIELTLKYPKLLEAMKEDYVTNAFDSGWNINKVC
jgi:hypothetical protein